MEGNNSITPVTDEEQWSDATGTSSENGTSPQAAGYAPLENYQILQDEDDEDEEVEEKQEKEERGSPAQGTAEDWREDARDRGDAEAGGGGGRGGGGGGQQGDVASLMLRAMEADYRACIESEERSTSNGPNGISVIAGTAENEPEDEKEQVDGESLTPVQQQAAEGPAGRGQGEAAAAQTPRRPLSPLGRDRADRVMRAMQGFALPAPPLPPAGFDADWGSPGALANLAANGSADQGEDTAGRGETGPNED